MSLTDGTCLDKLVVVNENSQYLAFKGIIEIFSKGEGQASSVHYMYICKVKGNVLRCFEFVRTDWPDHSHCNAISTFIKTIQSDQSNPK